MDWVLVGMIAAGLALVAVATVFVLVWTAGEVVGSISELYSTSIAGDRIVRLIVKRIAPSGNRRTPTLIVRIGIGADRLSAIEALRLADTLDAMVDGKTPRVMTHRGFKLGFISSQVVGVTTEVGTDTPYPLTTHLDYADAHTFAKLLRTAASTEGPPKTSRS